MHVIVEFNAKHPSAGFATKLGNSLASGAQKNAPSEAWVHDAISL